VLLQDWARPQSPWQEKEKKKKKKKREKHPSRNPPRIQRISGQNLIAIDKSSLPWSRDYHFLFFSFLFFSSFSSCQITGQVVLLMALTGTTIVSRNPTINNLIFGPSAGWMTDTLSSHLVIQLVIWCERKSI